MDTISTAVDSKNIRGIVTTIYGSSRSLGGALAPVAFSVLLDIGFPVPFYLSAAGVLGVALLVLFVLDEKKLLPEQLLPSEH